MIDDDVDNLFLYQKIINSGNEKIIRREKFRGDFISK